MPSPAELRPTLEAGCRLLGLGALGAALWLSIGARDGATVRRVTSDQVPGILANGAAIDSLLLVTDTALGPIHRDWLRALRSAGTTVRWANRGVAPLAAVVEPVGDPAGSLRIDVAAPDGAVGVSDRVGGVDSGRATGGGISFATGRLVGEARVAAGRGTAVAAPADSTPARTVIVFGRPTWETRFVVAALEEEGWRVAARIPLRPDTAAILGSPNRIDTATVAAVVALDSAAAPAAARIVAFVRDGGGLVLGAEAASLAGLAPLRVGAVGVRRPAPLFEVGSSDPRAALAVSTISPAAGDPVPLERRHGGMVVAARRAGIGRVVQVGYEDTWRWRMTGPDGSVAAHRRWWSALVSSVGHRPIPAAARPARGREAPLARMVEALGPAIAGNGREPAESSSRGSGPPAWLFLVAVAALLAEWTSRRLRGVA